MLGACPAPPPAQEKASFGNMRLLYLFAPNGKDRELRRQQAYLAPEMAGCKERNLEIRVDTLADLPHPGALGHFGRCLYPFADWQRWGRKAS
ncbi:MAG: DUF4174 domain-containing protein [Microscillaceae bacterium]|nr:DUF4174 domain-containing protein [Microscillaceae bacterium]